MDHYALENQPDQAGLVWHLTLMYIVCWTLLAYKVKFDQKILAALAQSYVHKAALTLFNSD